MLILKHEFLVKSLNSGVYLVLEKHFNYSVSLFMAGDPCTRQQVWQLVDGLCACVCVCVWGFFPTFIGLFFMSSMISYFSILLEVCRI